jgi:eukaryotic-like serine/threonine-protein kinase
MTDPLPKNIGEYEIIRELDHGGFARVYLARDPDLNRQVAIKRLHRNPNDPGLNRRFREEAENAATLEHPNIVTIYRIIHEIDLAIVMQYAEGGSLDKRIREHGPFGWKDFLSIFRKICEALEYAHHKGVLHCDLKPANILLTGKGEPLLSDFGLSRKINPGPSEVSTILGTTGYSAPEVSLNKFMEKSIDIYSLGCVAGELLIGQKIFSTAEDQNQGKPIYSQPTFAGWPVGVPAGIEAVLNQALSLVPSERFQSAMELYDALAALDAPRPTAIIGSITQPLPPTGRTDTPSQSSGKQEPAAGRKRGWVLPATIVGVLAVLGGFGSFLVLGNGGSLLTPTAMPTVAGAALETNTQPVLSPSPSADSAATVIAATIAARAQEATIEAAVNATSAAIQQTTLSDATAGAQAQATAGADQTVTAQVSEQTAEAEQATLQAAEAAATNEILTATANITLVPTSVPPTSAPPTNTTRPTARATNATQPTTAPTAIPPSPTSGGSVIDSGGSGSLFRGAINQGANGDGPNTCVQGSVKRADGGNYRNFYVQLDSGGSTQPAKHDYSSGTFALCGLSAGVWGVAVYAVEDVPTNDSERVAHQVRFRASGTTGEIFYINFKALQDPPTPTPVPATATNTPLPVGPYDGFWEGTVTGTTATGAFTGRFAFEIRSNVVFYTAASGASCLWEDRNIGATIAGAGFSYAGRASSNTTIFYEVSANFASPTQASGGLYADQNGACITGASWQATKVR